jgi:(1->4)-alpha-D-glucan 1-alpha-D-glucosylmutase
VTVRSTYRLQLHKGFTFADAEAVVPYLARLGISHLYASPITNAQPGSTHGYDVTDPTRVNPELGGEEGLRSLCAALKREGLGLIIDIVPNHMGIAGGNNAYWQDVLEKGPASPYAGFFDIDWGDKLLLPFLGEPLEEALGKGALRIERNGDSVAVVAYGSTPYPIRREDHPEALEHLGKAPPRDLLERQHWRLAWWRTGNDELNWRRFFTITELAGLRAEDEAVFEATHALYFRLWDEKLIDGVRIDHIDGLADPATYLDRLRRRMPGSYIVVEKILGPGEPLPPEWPVEGTSGYDFMEQVSALLHDPAGEAPLTDLWAQVSGRPPEFAAEELAARRQMLSWEFEGQLASCVWAFKQLASSAPETAALTGGMLRRAIERLLWTFPVYRTYGPDAPESDRRTRDIARARALLVAPPGEAPVIERILCWLAGEGPGEAELMRDAVRRFQQLSAPIAAKAVEDTAFYRYGRLLSRNDVGFEPAHFASSPADFHAQMAARAELLPRSMLATATHDHKRGEDVRARLAVTSEIAEEWRSAVERWNKVADADRSGVAADDIYQLYQMLAGAWPARLDGFAERIIAWQQKALREAKLRSSWAAPDEDYEATARAFVETILRSEKFVREMAAFVERIRPAAEANGLVQAFLRCTAPGVPDLYQGTEYEDLSLVDPDNRRPVDFDARTSALDALADSYSARKQALIAKVLRLRQDRPHLWEGGWEKVEVSGVRAAHVIAFTRRAGGELLLGVAALRLAGPLQNSAARVPGPEWWADTIIHFPAGRRPAADLFGDAPVHLSADRD